MKLDNLVKVTSLILIIALVGFGAFSYTLYGKTCSNQTEYNGSSLFYSNDLYKICGDSFSLTNTGEDTIQVIKYEANSSDEVTSETLITDATQIEAVNVTADDAIELDTKDGVIYKINTVSGNPEDIKVKVANK